MDIIHISDNKLIYKVQFVSSVPPIQVVWDTLTHTIDFVIHECIADIYYNHVTDEIKVTGRYKPFLCYTLNLLEFMGYLNNLDIRGTIEIYEEII